MVKKTKMFVSVPVNNPENIPGDFNLEIEFSLSTYQDGQPIIIIKIPFDKFKIFPGKILRIVSRVKKE